MHRLKACLVALQTIAYKMIKPKLTMLNDYAIEIICLHYFLKLNRFEFKKKPSIVLNYIFFYHYVSCKNPVNGWTFRNLLIFLQNEFLIYIKLSSEKEDISS